METTLDLDPELLRRLRAESVQRGEPMSKLVEAGLRLLFEQRKPDELRPLPTFHSGGLLVDISNRDALYDAMDEP